MSEIPKRPKKEWKDMTTGERFAGLTILAVIAVMFIWFVAATIRYATHHLTVNLAANDTSSQQSAPELKSYGTQTNTSNQSAATQAQKPKPSQSTITGYGATQDDWNANHHQDPAYANNEVYDPTPGLGIDSSHTDKYYSLSTTSSRVTGYEMRLPNDQKLALSQKNVIQEFPSDASILWQKSSSQCSQMEVQSKLLGSVLNDASIGDSGGQVFIEFQTDTKDTQSLNTYYSPSNVNLAILQLGSYSTAADAPDC